MSLTNIKLNSQRGFTIVELLIVVVVIAILAAITIVSYNGITNNAKKSASQSAATTLAKKAELYNGDLSRYPSSAADLAADTSKSWYMATLNGATFTHADLASAPSDPNAVTIRRCASGTPGNQAAITSAPTTVTGLIITWWDFTKTTGQATQVLVGTTTGTGIACPTTAS